MSNVTYEAHGEVSSHVLGLLDPDNNLPLGLYYTYLVLISIWCLLGIFGNILVIISVCTNKNLRTLPHIFVVNLACCDILVASIVDPLTVVGILTGDRMFRDRFYLCHIVGCVCLVACTGSLWNIMVISFNRYAAFCNRQLYHKVFDEHRVYFWLFGVWIACLLLDLPNFLGFGGHVFDQKMMICAYDQEANYLYTILFALSAIVFPIIVVVCSYIRIFICIKNSAKAIAKVGGIRSTSKGRDMQLVISLLAIFISFTVLWMPYGVAVLLDINVSWGRTTYVVLILMAHANSSLNWLIYGLTNRQFRKSYWQILLFLLCQSSPVINVTNHSAATHAGRPKQQYLAVRTTAIQGKNAHLHSNENSGDHAVSEDKFASCDI